MLSGVRARSCVGVVTALGCMFVLTGAASAAPTWLGALDLSSVSAFAQQPGVAVDPGGEAVAVWTDNTGDLETSVHPLDGAWQPPKTIASSVSGGDQVAFDADGNVTALWVDRSGVVESATLPVGAAGWSAPTPVSPADAASPELAVNAQGDAVAVWTISGTGVEAAFRPAGTSAWQAPVPLSTSSAVSAPQVALDPQDDATAVWVQTSTSEPVVWAASRPGVSGIWQTPVPLSNSTVASGGPEVAFDSAGRSTAMWSDPSGIHAADQAPGAAWSSPVTVPASAGGFDPSLAEDPQGVMAATWDQPAGRGVAIADAATRPSGGTWQTPVALSTAQSSSHTPDPRVKLDARGDAVAVWDAFDGSNNTAVAASRPAGGSWPAPGAAETLSGAATIPVDQQLAVDSQGDAVAVWSVSDGSTNLVQAAGYDAAGPLLNGLSIPASGTSGVPVTFSVAPLDAWSPVASTTWSFGDGQKGSDETLSHTYASAGAYTVTVTSADTLGNSTSESRTITIVAAPTTTSAPTLTAVSETHKKWRESSKPRTATGRQKQKPPPVGTSFSFTVDQATGVTFAFSRASSGRKIKGKCRPATRDNHKHPACHSIRLEGTLTDAVGAGRHTISFRGRIGKRKLPLGAYTLRLTATNSHKQRSRTAMLKFAVVK